jgi:RNA polymerase sigma-70 factor (ECF subfamily)
MLRTVPAPPAAKSGPVERFLEDIADDFDLLVITTADELYRLAARLTGNLADAEDILQATYAKAFEMLSERRFERRASVKTWLYRIATNAAIDLLRRRGRKPILALSDAMDGQRLLEARAQLRELAVWLDDLPADQRAVLVLKELEGLTAAQTADVLGCTEGAVEQRLVRARTSLRARCERE